MKMQQIPVSARRHLSRFARDENGTVLTEFVIYIPILFWAWLAMFAFWDAYRDINVAQKASYAIADMISREQTAVTNNYRDGLRNVFAYMAGTTNSHVKVRFTSITYSIDNTTTGAGSFKVHWSYSPDATLPKLTTATLQSDFKNTIPIMSPGDYVLMIETRLDYTPPLDIPLLTNMITTRRIDNVVITRPRFMRVCESGQTCS